ncbi:hypothetical protein GWR56_07970 [Mucilaginibacter sp. 14171R-50]|uniref:hypothetical protein n=1 Tax=Mucilaginibacter sp. 14171R-50 TaxID=2703789 RepID=UPI00138B65FD|nr:hypothetical protein [Mucilaginibacter sp. 14171R-50]QHS55477.1 hypothetical protein GWR56_07970 [Mucilaginibacter sp. 14171R-50]
MKKYILISYIFFAVALMITACEKKQSNTMLQGTWKSKDANTSLKITGKKFIMDGDEQSAEDYFVKGDTIFTSFEGNQPFTKFVIQKVDESNLILLYPDSVVVNFSR